MRDRTRSVLLMIRDCRDDTQQRTKSHTFKQIFFIFLQKHREKSDSVFVLQKLMRWGGKAKTVERSDLCKSIFII